MTIQAPRKFSWRKENPPPLFMLYVLQESTRHPEERFTSRRTALTLLLLTRKIKWHLEIRPQSCRARFRQVSGGRPSRCLSGCLTRLEETSTIPRAGKIENISIEENVDRRAFTERWKNVNDYVMYPSVQWPSAGHTERFVERNNELYLSAINISYNLEGDWLKKIGLRRLGLGIGFSDIARLSTVKYELGTSYPYMRGYNFTISPTF